MLTLVMALAVRAGIEDVAAIVASSPSAALAGTTTRLNTMVRANSKERNFFM